MNQHKIITSVASLLMIAGCSLPMPDSNFDINDAVLVSADTLVDTRHFHVVSDIDLPFIDEVLNRQKATLVNQNDYQQVFIMLDKEDLKLEERIERLSTNLSRTCWANREDAIIKSTTHSIRGIESDNIMSACVSLRLGENHPLFVFSQIKDSVLGDYFMLVAPTKHFTSQKYQCKLKAEGYHFTNQHICL